MTARKHHYVPQCYLKGFVKNLKKPLLFVVDVEEKKSFLSHPIGVCAERDFNSIEVDSLPSDAFENAYSGFENALADCLRRIIQKRSIDDTHDRSFLFNLISISYIKNPSTRTHHAKYDAIMAERIMEIVTSTPEILAKQVAAAKKACFIEPDKDIDYQKLRKFFNDKEYTIEIPNEKHLLREIDLHEKTLPLIFRRKWLLLKATSGATNFITSDRPAFLRYYGSGSGRVFFGLGTAQTELVFPVSNNLLLIGRFEGEDAVLEANDQMIAVMNGATIAHAARQIYAQSDDFKYSLDDGTTIKLGKSLLDNLIDDLPDRN